MVNAAFKAAGAYFNALIHFWSSCGPNKMPQWATFGPWAVILTRALHERGLEAQNLLKFLYSLCLRVPQECPESVASVTPSVGGRWRRHLVDIQDSCSLLFLSSERLQLHRDPHEMRFFPRKVPSSSLNSDIISVQTSEWLHSQQLFHVLDSLRKLLKFAVWNQAPCDFQLLITFPWWCTLYDCQQCSLKRMIILK